MFLLSTILDLGRHLGKDVKANLSSNRVSEVKMRKFLPQYLYQSWPAEAVQL